MIILKRHILLIVTLLISLEVKAHQPDVSSTILVEQSPNQWVLQVRAALTAFEYEVEHNYGEASYATPEEFQQLAIKHLRGHLSIVCNDSEAVILKRGKVNLGHETSATFELEGTPEAIQSMQVTNSSFGDISRNQSALMILKKGYDRNKFTLNNKNEHSVELKFGKSQIELVAPAQAKRSNSNLMFLATCMLMLIAFLGYRQYPNIRSRKKNLILTPS